VRRIHSPLAREGDLAFIQSSGGFVVDVLNASLGDFQVRSAQGAACRR